MPDSQSYLKALEQMGKLNRKLKSHICRNIDAPIVANMRLEYLDLAIKRHDFKRKLRHRTNMKFLEGCRTSTLTACRDRNLVKSFVDDREFLVLLINKRTRRVIRSNLKSIFYDFLLDSRDPHIHRLYSIKGFWLDPISRSPDDLREYHTRVEKILDKLLVQNPRCHLCAFSYLHRSYPTKYFLRVFLDSIRRSEVLEYVLQMTYAAGVDIWAPEKLGHHYCDPVLHFMLEQRFELVHTLIDYGYTICRIRQEDKRMLTLGLFGRYPVTIRPHRKLQALFYEEPYKTIMILFALGHCATPRADGFLSAYERLHKSLSLPHYSASYIRSYLRGILDVAQYHRMIEERCFNYEWCGLQKYPVCSPRSLLDLATCAYRDVLQRLPCQLPTAISQLEFPIELKNLVALKT